MITNVPEWYLAPIKGINMRIHKELPEALRKQVLQWYHVSLLIMSILLFSLAGIQWYTWYAYKQLRQKIAHYQHTMLTTSSQRQKITPHKRFELTRLFIEVCNRTPTAIQLTKLTIQPTRHITCHGTTTDPHALTELITHLAYIGFPHLIRMNTTPLKQAISFEICCEIAAQKSS